MALFPFLGRCPRLQFTHMPKETSIRRLTATFFIIVVVQLLSRGWFFETPWTVAHQASLSTMSQSLLKLMSSELLMPSNHLVLCHLLLLLSSIFPSIRVFSSESAVCVRWPQYWSFSFRIRPSNEYPGLISFRTDWFDLLVVQGTLKSLLSYNNKRWNLSTRSSVGKFINKI